MSLAGHSSNGASRVLVLAGGLVGAAGVALSAAAAHRGGAFAGTAASFLLMHAPVFLAIGLIGGNRCLRTASLVLLVGLLLFSGDLFARDFLGSRLFPMAIATLRMKPAYRARDTGLCRNISRNVCSVRPASLQRGGVICCGANACSGVRGARRFQGHTSWQMSHPNT